MYETLNVWLPAVSAVRVRVTVPFDRVSVVGFAPSTETTTFPVGVGPEPLVEVTVTVIAVLRAVAVLATLMVDVLPAKPGAVPDASMTTGEFAALL
jgi:hypothetical protein